MTDGQFWFVMTCLIVLLDALAYRERWKQQRENRAWWAEYDAESKRRHENFMTAIAEERADRGLPPRRQGWKVN